MLKQQVTICIQMPWKFTYGKTFLIMNVSSFKSPKSRVDLRAPKDLRRGEWGEWGEWEVPGRVWVLGWILGELVGGRGWRWGVWGLQEFWISGELFAVLWREGHTHTVVSFAWKSYYEFHKFGRSRKARFGAFGFGKEGSFSIGYLLEKKNVSSRRQ